MGNFDAASVIRAAATSHLGVISLLVLVLAFLAWRFFQRSDDKVKLIAFAMMFLGAAGFVAAVMLAGSDASGDATEPGQTAAAPERVPETPPDQAGGGSRVIDLEGLWRDTEGYRYRFTQESDAFLYTMFLDGEQVGSGAGSISGRRLTYQFADSANGNQGACRAEVSADARTISGTCDDGSAEWNFSIQR